MRYQDISHSLKAVAEVARTGEQLVDSLDRSRSRGYLGSVFVGVVLGIGLGALLFSEPARQRIKAWLTEAPQPPRASIDEGVERSVAPPIAPRVEAAIHPA